MASFTVAFLTGVYIGIAFVFTRKNYRLLTRRSISRKKRNQLRWLLTVVPICPTSLQYRPIKADRAFFPTWRQYVTTVKYLELGFDNVAVVMATWRSYKTGLF
jgi:hypothetical protein